MVALQCVLRPARPQELWLLLQCKMHLLDCNKSGSHSGIAGSDYSLLCVSVVLTHMTMTKAMVKKQI